MTRGNAEAQKEFYKKFIKEYKGFCFYNDDIVVFYNKAQTDDPRNVIGAIKKNLMAPPANPFNTCAIDFAAFKNFGAAKVFFEKVDEPDYKYVLFVKNNEPKLYLKEELLRNIGRI